MKKVDELESWVSLWRVPRVGPKTYQKLLDNIGQPDKVFQSKHSALIQAGISDKVANNILVYQTQEKRSEVSKPDIDWLQDSENHHIITIDCDEYPALLKQISDPPQILYAHGNFTLLNDPQLAIVGSRNPTQGGLNASYDFANYLAKTGFCITSGLALGVDGEAHKGALDADAPTIAVIATGIDRVYPAKHRELAHRIVENGLIISEFPIGTQPRSENFPRRNRIISGLSYGTLVVEAAQRSGSLITARTAMEQNREVFAIPGSIHNPLAKGCHQLIRQGAKLVETGHDILEEMASVVDVSAFDSQPERFIESSSINNDINNGTNNTINKIKVNEQITHNSDSNEEYQTLLDKMGFDPTPIDQLVIRTGYSPESIAAMLLILELQNQVSSNGGGTYTRLI